MLKDIIQKTFRLFLSNYFLLFLYIAIVSVVSYNHEVWRDEVDPWLLARDVDLPGLFRYSRNSGHPALWHIILIPFAKLGFPNFTLSIVHLSFAISTAYLFLFHSTLKKYLVVLLIFGYYFLFEYAIIARNYAVSIFLLFLIATLYSKRFEKPILFAFLFFLLENCNIYMTIVASGIGLIYLIEIVEQKNFKPRILLGLAIMIIGAIACMLQLIPTDERQASPTNTGMFHMINSMALPVSLAFSFLPGVIGKRAIWSLFFIPVGFFVFFRIKKLFIFFTWVILILSFIFTFVYMTGHRHAGFLLLTIVFALWIKPHYETIPKPENIYNSLSEYCFSFIKEPEKLFQIMLTISFLVSLRYSYQESVKDILYSYSNVKEVSEYIMANGYDSDKYIIATHNPDRGKAILYYLKNKKTLYYPALESFGSHMWWTKKNSEAGPMDLDDVVNATREKFKGQNDILFLSDTELREDKDRYELIYITKSRVEFVKDENFFLYKLK